MTSTTAMSAPKELGQSAPLQNQKLELESFLELYSDMEDGYKYEFDQGIVEKTPRSMTPAQSFILRNLHHRFIKTKAYQEGGDLQVEIEMLTKPDQMRKPDISFRSAAQIASGDYSVSSFAVEVISKHDKIAKIKRKTKEYFAAGMEVLWLIYPDLEEVEIYTSPKKSQVYSGKETVSAKPAVPDFNLKASEVFVKPTVA